MKTRVFSSLRRVGALLLCFVLLLSVVSCGGSDSPKSILADTVSRASLGSKIPSSVKKKTLTADGLGSAFGIWESAPSFLRGYVYEPSIVPNTLVFGCVEVEPEHAEETAKDFLSKMNLGKQVCVVYDKKIAVAAGKYILLVMGEEDVCAALEVAFHESVAALSEK